MSLATSPKHGSHGALFEGQAAVYAEYRPGYPRNVYEAIYNFAQLPEKGTAVDIGCGTGQVAVGLAEEFREVIGLDSSQGQIQHAAPGPNIRYAVAPAEATGLPDHSVDLVVAAQCLHWFDVPLFYKECRRILRPGAGALAVFGYMPTRIRFPGSEEAGEVLRQLHPKIHHYFHERRQRFLLTHYEGWEPTPEDFKLVQTCVVDMERRMSVEQIVGWVRSMSGWHQYKQEHGEKSMEALLGALQADLLRALGVADARTPVLSVWPLAMILAKDPISL